MSGLRPPWPPPDPETGMRPDEWPWFKAGSVYTLHPGWPGNLGMPSRWGRIVPNEPPTDV